MSDIRVNAFKDYRVERDPKIASVVDDQISTEYFGNDGGPSDMYDMEVSEFKSQLPNVNSSFEGFTALKSGRTFRVYSPIQPLKVLDNTKNYRRLEKVFDFLEKREGKQNPLKASKEVVNKIKLGVLYPGKYGFGLSNPNTFPDESTPIRFIPYPISLWHHQNNGGSDWIQPYITDVKDGGVFVWNDALEREIKDDSLY